MVTDSTPATAAQRTWRDRSIRPCKWCGGPVTIRFCGDVKVVTCLHCDRGCPVGLVRGCPQCKHVERTKG